MPGQHVYTIEEDGQRTYFATTKFEARRYMAERIRQLMANVQEDGETAHMHPKWRGGRSEEPGLYILYDLPRPPIDVTDGKFATDGMEVWRARVTRVGAGYIFGNGEERVVWDDAPLHRVALTVLERCPRPCVADDDLPGDPDDIVRAPEHRVVRSDSPHDALLRSIEAFRFAKHHAN